MLENKAKIATRFFFYKNFLHKKAVRRGRKMPHNSKPQFFPPSSHFNRTFSFSSPCFRSSRRHPVMEWNATITDMKFHFKNNAFGQQQQY